MKDRTYWYASNTVRARVEIGLGAGARSAVFLVAPSRVFGVLRLRDADGIGFRDVNVTDRSAWFIDRIARDWIAHGVTPAKNGRRGIAVPACSRRRVQINDGWPVAHADNCVILRFERIEIRARRVVRT